MTDTRQLVEVDFGNFGTLQMILNKNLLRNCFINLDQRSAQQSEAYFYEVCIRDPFCSHIFRFWPAHLRGQKARSIRRLKYAVLKLQKHPIFSIGYDTKVSLQVKIS